MRIIAVILFALFLPFMANADDCPVGTYRMNLDASIGGTNYTYDNSAGTWTANFDYDDVSGISTCNSTGGSWGTAYPQYNFEQGTSGVYCWCKMTGPARSAWVCDPDYGSASDCAEDCAAGCARSVRFDADFRTGMFGSVECESCTNKPANSHYTSNATTNNCPWECDDGYYNNNGTCTLCEAGYMCSGGVKTACTGATYTETTGATSCTQCPAAIVYANRVTAYGYWIEGGVQTSRYGCRAAITEQDPTGDYALSCSMNNGDYGTGGSARGCLAGQVTSCIAGRYVPENDNPYGNVLWAPTVQNIEGNVCVDAGAGYYSPDGDLARYACTNKPEHSSYSGSAGSNNCPWECDTGYTKSGNSCVANTYTINYVLGGGTSGTSHPTTATFDEVFYVDYPTQAHANFNGWTITGLDTDVTHYYGTNNAANATTGTTIEGTWTRYFLNLRATSGTVTFQADWRCYEGYWNDNGTCTICPAGYACSGGVKTNCASSNGANGRPQYSDAGASQCTECPAETGALASRVVHYSYFNSWDSGTTKLNNKRHGCNAYFSDTDENATFRTLCYYDFTNNNYGTTGGCFTTYPTACAAGKYDTITTTTEWRSDENAFCYGVDCMKGKVCTDVGTGYYSPAGDTARYECTNKPEHSSYSGSAASNSCPWTCDANYTEYKNACHGFCSGNRKLRIGTNPVTSYPAFSDKTNVPSPVLHIKDVNDEICYIYFEPDVGGEHGVKVLWTDGKKYHAVDPTQ